MQISANANIGPNSYQAQAYTDSNGNYSLNVVNTNTWNVNVSCNGGNNTLDSILGSGNYVCPNSVGVSINNNNGVADFVVASTAVTPDVLSYFFTKQENFFQVNSSVPVPDTNYGPFNAYLDIIQSSLNLVPVATVTLPTSAVKGFPSGSTAIELQVQEQFASQSAFDAAYPTGNYSFAISTVDNGNQYPILNLPPFTYPSAPHISNFAAAQNINPNNAFLVQWDAFAGGLNTNGTIWLFINDTNGNQIFSTPFMGSATPPLNETNTSATIPAGTLQFGHAYVGVLNFFKGLTNNTTDYPGALGVTVASTSTSFALNTLSTTPAFGQPLRVSATQFGFNLGGVPGSNYTILTTTNLSVPLSNWLTVLVTNLPTQSVFIQDNNATNQQRFYRIKAGP